MKKIIFALLFFCLLNHSRADFWTQKANYPGAGQELPISFEIGNMGYAGCGTGAFDFWEYDPVTNNWTQKANVPGSVRRAGVGFSINNLGYAGTGDGPLSDFYEYDPVADTWTAKASISIARSFATGFSIGNKGYVGCGQSPFMNDFWEYDPATNAWTQKSSLPFERSHSVGFSISGLGYMSTGLDLAINTLNDIWEYDPVANTWTQKAALPGGPRTDARGFVICNKGYVMSGGEAPLYDDLWQFDPVLNQWIQKTNVPGGVRDDGASFAIGNKGYFGLGQLTGSVNTNDFWEYTPDSACGLLPAVSLYSSDTLFCGKSCLDFFDLSTNNPTSWQWLFPGADSTSSNMQNPTGICYNSFGSFDVTLIACNASGCDTLFLPGFINEFSNPPVPVVTWIGDSLFSTPSFAYQWYYNSSAIAGANSQYYVTQQPGSYFVVVTDSNGCASSSIVLSTGIDQVVNNNGNLFVLVDPVNGNFMLYGAPVNAILKIFDFNGQVVYCNRVKAAAERIQLKASDGIYFMEIINGNKFLRKKIILRN